MPDVEIGKSALTFQKIEVVLRQDGGTVGARTIEIGRFINGFRERVVQLERQPLSELLAEPRLQAVIVRIHHRLRCQDLRKAEILVADDRRKSADMAFEERNRSR